MSTNHRSPAAARKRPLPDEKNEPNRNSLNHNKHTASNDTTTTTTAIHRSKRVNISPSLPTLTHNHTDTYDCNGGDDNDDDDDDDEVEFLLCIDPPPDVSTQVQEVTTSSQQEEKNKEVMASISPITPLSSLSLKSSSLKPPSPLLLSLLPISAFPLSSSAYFQSLAEICYAILWDARWRVQEVDGESDHHHHQHQHRRLFTWEQGDDLSVIHTLSRRYVEPPDHSRKQSNNNDNDDDTNSHDNDTSNELNQEEQKLMNEEEENNNDHDRCLEMYTRLYFRKGCVSCTRGICNRYIKVS